MRSRESIAACVVTALVAALLCSDSALAAPGDLDPGFGKGGRATIPLPDEQGVTDMALDDAGRPVLVGFDGVTNCSHIDCTSSYDTLLARLTPAGRLDPTFGDEGLLAPANGGIDPYGPWPVLGLQSDGTLIVANGGQIRRFDEDGTEESPAPDAAGPAADVEVLPDDSFLVGIAYGPTAEFVVEKRLADGEPDLGFGTDGSVSTAPSPQTQLLQVVLDPSGGFWALGITAETSVSDTRLTIARFENDGTPDSGFGVDGVGVYPASSQSTAVDALADDDGSLRVFLRPYFGGDRVLHIEADGSLDAGFGKGGVLIPDSPHDAFTVGAADMGGGRTALIRQQGPSILDADGTIDRGFGDDGMATPYSYNAAGGVRDGNSILTYGTTGEFLLSPDDMDVARFTLGNGPADADADGIGDADDACSDTYGARQPDGCPLVRRELTLRRESGILKAAVGGIAGYFCPSVTVHLKRAGGRDGRRRWSQELEGEGLGEVWFRGATLKGRYTARFAEKLSPPVGRCVGAMSNAVRLKRTR